MKPLLCMLAATAVLATGCSGADDTAATAAAPAAPVATVTATVTQTVTASAEPLSAEDLADLGSLDDLIEQLDSSSGAAPAQPRPPKLKLRVFSDGCGVIRSRPAPGTTYDNLTWTFLDQDGFQVLGRNAEGETRYRYFQGGTYDVVLEAFVNGAYRPVSNKVTVTC